MFYSKFAQANLIIVIKMCCLYAPCSKTTSKYVCPVKINFNNNNFIFIERFPLRLDALYIKRKIYNQLQLKHKRQVKNKITEIITK